MSSLPEVQKFDLSKYLKAGETFIGWLVIHAITLKDKEGGTLSTANAIVGKTSPDGKLDVQFTVNGISLPFEETMLAYEKHVRAEIVAEGRRLFQEVFHNATQILNDTVQEATKKLREHFDLPDDDKDPYR